MNFFDFLEKHIILPAKNPGKYNIVNTIFYILIALSIVYLFYKFIEKRKIKINKEFIISLLPFIIFGIFYRTQVDYRNFSSSLLTVTPGAWIIPFSLWFLGLNIFNDYKQNVLFGSFILLYSLFFFKIYLNISLLLFILAVLLYILFSIKEKFIYLALFGQFYDGIISYIKIKMGYMEEHVLPSIIIENISPEAFFITKIGISLLVIYLINRENIDKNLKNYFYLLIFLLGFGPGSRNLLI